MRNIDRKCAAAEREERCGRCRNAAPPATHLELAARDCGGDPLNVPPPQALRGLQERKGGTGTSQCGIHQEWQA